MSSNKTMGLFKGHSLLSVKSIKPNIPISLLIITVVTVKIYLKKFIYF